MSSKTGVAVVKLGSAAYPRESPFHPDTVFPEYPFEGGQTSHLNLVYEGVRRLLLTLGLDREHYGSRFWNPLGHLIQPGMTVVVKPNFVVSENPGRDLFAAITHPSVLRAVMDYVWIALKRSGRIIIADGPQYDCNWAELLRATRLDQVVEFYNGFSGPRVELLDLREYWSRWKHFQSCLEPLPGDPRGVLTVNLGKRSALYGVAHNDKLYGAVYHRKETISHHKGDTHEYELSATVMKADVVVSVPKLKVHKKVGVTLNTKGLVGICTNKNYLVHYRTTSPSRGGDQYPDGLFTPLEETLIRTERWMYDHLLAPRKRVLEYLHRSIYSIHNNTTRRLGIKVSEKKRNLDAGNWYGNDSAWRMAVDLLRSFCFASSEGVLCETRQRSMFSIIDGVVGGQGNGPLAPDAVESGVLLGGDNLLAVDLVAARLMGFDPLKVRMYQALLTDPAYDFGIRELEDVRVICDVSAVANCLNDRSNPFFNFRPHPGWTGHLEVKPENVLSFC
jgi:uncharacterized protein (DUF362 family)